MKIRAAGLSADTLALLGVAPEAMPQPEAYEALARGIVDGNLAPAEVLQGWRHAEVTTYLTRTPFLYNAVFFVTMNQQRWDDLPADLQEVFLAVNEQFFEDVAAGLWDTQNECAVEWAVGETGQEIITLSEEEKAIWIERVSPIQEDFVSRMDQLGFDGNSILETVRRLADGLRIAQTGEVSPTTQMIFYPFIYLVAVGFAGFAYLISMPAAFALVSKDLFSTFSNYSLRVIPMFIWMGFLAYHAGIGARLYNLAYKMVGHLPGGLPLQPRLPACSSALSAVQTPQLLPPLALSLCLK